MQMYIRVGEGGYIDEKLLELVTPGISTNFDSLRELVNSPLVIEVEINNKYTYLDREGTIGEAKMSYTQFDAQYPEDRDLNFEKISGLSTGEMGFYGKTLFPDNIGLENSTNGNIKIIINAGLSSLGAAETFSHEGYGHALLYIINGNNHNGASHIPVPTANGPTDQNVVLRNMILRSRRETVCNFNNQ